MMHKVGAVNSRSVVSVLFTTILGLTAAANLTAQDSSGFAALQEHINKQVTVQTADRQITGQLLRVEESRLVVYEAGSPKPIARETVRKVIRHKSRHTGAWIGGMTAAGLGAGFLIGFRSFDDATNANSKIGAAAGAGAGAGAAAGYALSRIGNRDEVVYQSDTSANARPSVQVTKTADAQSGSAPVLSRE
jgi:hypothetical protein